MTIIKLDNAVDCSKLHPDVQARIQTILGILNRPLPYGNLNIVGTSDNPEMVQIYGWESPVKEHIDNTGHIFFMPLYIEQVDNLVSEEDGVTSLQIGSIYLLDDSKPHSTDGIGKVVALFLGCFKPNEITNNLKTHVYESFSSYLKKGY